MYANIGNQGQKVQQKLIELEVTPDMTIGEIKIQIAGLQGVSPENQRMIYKGAPLEDEGTLKSYGIDEKSICWIC